MHLWLQLQQVSSMFLHQKSKSEKEMCSLQSSVRSIGLGGKSVTTLHLSVVFVTFYKEMGLRGEGRGLRVVSDE